MEPPCCGHLGEPSLPISQKGPMEDALASRDDPLSSSSPSNRMQLEMSATCSESAPSTNEHEGGDALTAATTSSFADVVSLPPEYCTTLRKTHLPGGTHYSTQAAAFDVPGPVQAPRHRRSAEWSEDDDDDDEDHPSSSTQQHSHSHEPPTHHAAKRRQLSHNGERRHTAAAGQLGSSGSGSPSPMAVDGSCNHWFASGQSAAGGGCGLSSLEALVAACELAAEKEGLDQEECHYYEELVAESSDLYTMGAAGAAQPAAAPVAPVAVLPCPPGPSPRTAQAHDADAARTSLPTCGGMAASCVVPVWEQPAAPVHHGAADAGHKYRRHKSKVFIRPNKVVYLPTTFMEEAFDPACLPIKCDMVVEADGVPVVGEVHHVTIKAVPRQGLSTMYCMTNVMKFQQQYLNWQILNWTKLDDSHIKIHLQGPCSSGTASGLHRTGGSLPTPRANSNARHAAPVLHHQQHDRPAHVRDKRTGGAGQAQHGAVGPDALLVRSFSTPAATCHPPAAAADTTWLPVAVKQEHGPGAAYSMDGDMEVDVAVDAAAQPEATRRSTRHVRVTPIMQEHLEWEKQQAAIRLHKQQQQATGVQDGLQQQLDTISVDDLATQGAMPMDALSYGLDPSFLPQSQNHVPPVVRGLYTPLPPFLGSSSPTAPAAAGVWPAGPATAMEGSAAANLYFIPSLPLKPTAAAAVAPASAAATPASASAGGAGAGVPSVRCVMTPPGAASGPLPSVAWDTILGDVHMRPGLASGKVATPPPCKLPTPPPLHVPQVGMVGASMPPDPFLAYSMTLPPFPTCGGSGAGSGIGSGCGMDACPTSDSSGINMGTDTASTTTSSKGSGTQCGPGEAEALGLLELPALRTSSAETSTAALSMRQGQGRGQQLGHQEHLAGAAAGAAGDHAPLAAAAAAGHGGPPPLLPPPAASPRMAPLATAGKVAGVHPAAGPQLVLPHVLGAHSNHIKPAPVLVAPALGVPASGFPYLGNPHLAAMHAIFALSQMAPLCSLGAGQAPPVFPRMLHHAVPQGGPSFGLAGSVPAGHTGAQ